MRRSSLWALCGLVLIACCTLGACAGAGPKAEREGPLRVLILGDSISIAYTPVVRELFGEEAVVVRPTVGEGAKAENCEGTTKGLEALGRWLKIDGGGFDVIHYNFGLHDVKRVDPKTRKTSNNPEHPQQAPLEVYYAQLLDITEALEETGATLVFATTTPVPQGRVRPYRKPQDVVRYNGMGVSLAMSRGIAVNDLYAFVLPRLGELQRPGNVHFLPAGTRALAKEVVRAIRAAAE